MDKTQKTILIILLVVGIIVVTVGGTYAFFTSAISNNSLSTDIHELDIIYTGDTEISGNLNLTTDKSGGHRRVVSIGLSENSVGAKANIFIYIEQITAALATDALNWEVYKIENNQEVKYSSGNFLGCGELGETKEKCTSGARIYLVNNLILSTTTQEFAIYLWLDGTKAANEVVDAVLKGYIGAETENVTGDLS